jgi:biopolymer transport protein ExbB
VTRASRDLILSGVVLFAQPARRDVMMALRDARMNIRTLLQRLGPCWRLAAGYGLTIIVLFAANLAAAQEQLPGNPVDVATLPRDLSPWGMYMQADIVVKAVMIGLAIASFVTWTVWLAKTLELIAAKRRLRADLRTLAERHTDGLPRRKSIMGRFVDAAATELRLSEGAPEKEGIKERVALAFERIEKAAARRIMRGTGVLATIGATAPFVGLFGTVWGIMNSFIGISKSQTTNLAVVAPGIAEALLATALGLAAAIPAVIIYNVFSRQIAGYRDLVGDASAEVLRWVSRDLDRQGMAASQRAPALSAAE